MVGFGMSDEYRKMIPQSDINPASLSYKAGGFAGGAGGLAAPIATGAGMLIGATGMQNSDNPTVRGLGSTLSGAAAGAGTGASIGAAIGSGYPGIGTAIGAGVGALAGLLSNVFGGGKTTVVPGETKSQMQGQNVGTLTHNQPATSLPTSGNALPTDKRRSYALNMLGV